MKKNKTIAYMLAATLLVGGTFVGTKAWFSDQVTTDNGITITMGTLDLELKETEGNNINGEKVKGWTLVRGELDNESTTGRTARNGEVDNTFAEIRPGDYFEREFTVTNTGSLDQLVEVKGGHIEDTTIYDNLFTLTIDKGNEADKNDEIITEGEFRLNAGESRTIKLELKPNAERLTNTYQGMKFDFRELIDGITLTGRQINATKTQLSPEHQ